VQEALAKAIAMKQALVDTQRRITEDKQALTDITAEQVRIRDNLKSVQPNGPYYARLMGKLNDQETAIEKTQGDADALQKQLDAQRKELEAYVAGLNV
jgi:predicted  nucleic acid-binding Zn-ribbon protein